jgi:hypothetical protein
MNKQFLYRLLQVALWVSCLGSLSVSAILWLVDGRVRNETVITSTMRYDMGWSVDGKPMPVQWIDRYPNKEVLWQLLLALWFYPAKILIQTNIQSHQRQIIWYVDLVCLAVFWIWYRLVTWVLVDVRDGLQQTARNSNTIFNRANPFLLVRPVAWKTTECEASATEIAH